MGFIVVGSFFVMNLFVGVVINNFNEIKAESGKARGVLLTESQQEWADLRETMQKLRPKRRRPEPKNCLRRYCYRLVEYTSKGGVRVFDTFIMVCIILNTGVMAMTYFGQPYWYSVMLEVINILFAVIFTIEAIIKLTAYMLYYFHDPWNIFDFTIVVGTLVGLVVQYAAGISIGSIATVVRTFRVGRMFRLIQGAKSLRVLFNTLLLTLPSLANVGALLFLLFFIYSVMGVQLFSKVKFGSALNEHANFQSFGVAMLTLARSSTGENWNGIMYDLTNRDNCVDDPTFDSSVCGFGYGRQDENCVPINGCGNFAAYPFMLSFTVAVTFVMLNLFIGIIIDGFGESSSAEDQQLTKQQEEDFVNTWMKFDPQATGFLSQENLEGLFQILPEPLGFGVDFEANKYELKKRIGELEFERIHKDPSDGSPRYQFLYVMFALAKRVFKAAKGEDFEELPEGMGKVMNTDDGDYEAWDKGNAFARHFAVVQLVTTYRTYKFRQNMVKRLRNSTPGDARYFSGFLGDEDEKEFDGYD